MFVFTKTGVLNEVGLVLEAFPITSVYLAKLAGRIPEKSKLHYSRQASSVLLAHKTNDFPCHPVKTGLDKPREGPLEALGVVVSSKHPDSTTFLAPSMADHLLNRCVSVLFFSVLLLVVLLHHGWSIFRLRRHCGSYSMCTCFLGCFDQFAPLFCRVSTSPPCPALFFVQRDRLLGRFTAPGDKVLVTAFESNPLALPVVGSGRRLCALVADSEKIVNAEKQIEAALTSAMTGGWFAHLAKADKVLGGNVLPAVIPSNNLSDAMENNIATLTCEALEDDDEDDLDDAYLTVAKQFAGEHGIEIRVCMCHTWLAET